MKVWIDQGYCIDNGQCAEVAPEVFVMIDGLAYVREGSQVFAASRGNAEGAAGVAEVPPSLEQLVIEVAENCPGECIYLSS